MKKTQIIKEVEELKARFACMEAELRRLTVSSAMPEGEVETVLEIARVRAAGIDLEAYLRQRAKKRRHNSPRASFRLSGGA